MNLKIKNRINILYFILQILLFFYQFLIKLPLQISSPENIFAIIILVTILFDLFYFERKYYLIIVFIKFLLLSSNIYLNNNLELLYFFSVFQASLYFFSPSKTPIINYKIYVVLASLFILTFTTFTLFKIEFRISLIDLLIFYPLVHLFVSFIKLINLNKVFSAPFRKKETILRIIQNIQLSYIFFVGTLFYKFLLINYNSIYYTSFFLLILLICLNYEIKYIYYRKKYFDENPFKMFIFSILIFFIYLIINWLANITINSTNYPDILTNSMSMVTNIAIFNIASLFLLLQQNYNKYGSSYLIIKILKSPILVLFTVLPSIILILNYAILDKKNIISYLPSLILILSFSSSIAILIYFKAILETNILLNDLFLDIKKKDFENYNNKTINYINMRESKIDSILTITINIISKNDAVSSHSLFYTLSDWIKNNIDDIKDKDPINFNQQNNKFHNFFKIIVNCIINTNNNVIHINFINSIRDSLLSGVNSTNFYSFRIIYRMLFDYLYQMLESKSENVAYEIYRVIYHRSSEILLNLPPLEMENNSIVKFREDMYNFKEIFVNEISDIIDVSIKTHSINFVQRIHFYSDLFIGYQDKSFYQKWDAKIFDIYFETRHIINKKNKFILDNNKSLFSIKYDYEIFINYMESSYKSSSYNYNKILINYFYDSLLDIYTYAINFNKIKSDLCFEILWMLLIRTIQKNIFEIFKIYFIIFTYLIDKFLEKRFKENNPNIDLIKQVWGRILQLKNQDFNKCNKAFKSMIQTKYSFFHKKYKKLLNIEKMKYSFQSVDDINFINELDIEKKKNK